MHKARKPFPLFRNSLPPAPGAGRCYVQLQGPRATSEGKSWWKRKRAKQNNEPNELPYTCTFPAYNVVCLIHGTSWFQNEIYRIRPYTKTSFVRCCAYRSFDTCETLHTQHGQTCSAKLMGADWRVAWHENIYIRRNWGTTINERKPIGKQIHRTKNLGFSIAKGPNLILLFHMTNDDPSGSKQNLWRGQMTECLHLYV